MTLDETLLKELTVGLNDAAQALESPRNFRIFLDAGERESVRTSEFETRSSSELLNSVWGTLSLDPSNRAPIKGLSVLTIRATLEVLCEFRRFPTEPCGVYTELEDVRRILDGYAAEQNGKSFSYTDENDEKKKFSIVPSFSPAVCGDAAEIPSDFGEVLPVYMSIVYTAVEQGVNSNDITIIVDGEEVFFENAVMTRNKMVDTGTYRMGEGIEAAAVQHGFGLDVVVPMLKNNLGKMLAKEVLYGSTHEAHAVVVSFGQDMSRRAFLCIFGNVVANAQPSKNVGTSFSLVEVRPDLAIFGDDWIIVEKHADQSYSVVKTLTFDDLNFDKSSAYVAYRTICNASGEIVSAETFLFDGEDEALLDSGQRVRWVVSKNGF